MTKPAQAYSYKLCEPLALPLYWKPGVYLAKDCATPEKQDDSQSCYAKKIEKKEANIDWQLSADEIDRKIRAFNPFPICFTAYQGDRLRIHKARPHISASVSHAPGTLFVQNNSLCVACGKGQIEILELQLPGKKLTDAQAFINGFAAQLQKPIQLGESA